MSQKTESQNTAQADLFQLLRAHTDLLHRRLEKNLMLLTPPSRDRFVFALLKFLGFHRVWEPALQMRPDFAHIFLGRSRLRYIERDLAELGVPATRIAAAEDCNAAAALAGMAEHAMGSLYVMEGSTLGGSVIGRALSRQDWAPADGLEYFTPPQRDVRADWERLHEWAQATWPANTWPAIADGARATFNVLDAWVGTDVLS